MGRRGGIGSSSQWHRGLFPNLRMKDFGTGSRGICNALEVNALGNHHRSWHLVCFKNLNVVGPDGSWLTADRKNH